MHTYDARITLGAPRPLLDEEALDGVDEFLSTRCTTSAWRYEAAAREGADTPAASAGARPGSWSSPCTAVFRWTP